MTVTLELEPEIESRVRSMAKSTGKSVENILIEAIDEKFSEDSAGKSFQETATGKEWEAALYSLGRFSHPVPATCDDSRESIYGPREDAQL